MSTKPSKGSGRFSKGVSGNPSGRPAGSRNHSTMLMESLLAGEADQLTRKVLELALAGDIHALRMCLDRLLPPRRDRPIHLSLPPIESTQQIASAMSTVVGAISDGRITPGEGETLANILAVQTNVVGTGDLERRVEKLEQARSASNDGRGDAASATEEVVPQLP